MTVSTTQRLSSVSDQSHNRSWCLSTSSGAVFQLLGKQYAPIAWTAIDQTIIRAKTNRSGRKRSRLQASPWPKRIANKGVASVQYLGPKQCPPHQTEYFE